MQFLILWSAPLGWQIEGKKIECMDLQFLEQETEIQLCWTEVGLRMLTHYNGWSKHLEGWCLLSCCSGKCPSDLCPESPNSAAIKLAGMWKNEMVQAIQWVPVYSPSLQQQWHNGFFAMFVDNLHTQLHFDEEELTSPPDTEKLGT